MDFKQIIFAQRNHFRSGVTKRLSYRKDQLIRLYRWICKHEKLILEGLRRDLNKSPFEAYATEVGIVKEEIRFMLKHLDHWAQPKRVPTPRTCFTASSFICPEPYGVVLIMSPWNYPFQLAVAPLIAALGAGNCVVMKPSAYSSYTSKVIKKMVSDLFKPEYVTMVEGGRVENEALLDERFDYIFFTGSINVGKYVMKKAADNLIPISLELGGKSPCIVDETADVKLAARRIIWGKLINAGQTCVAPDYILVHKSVKEKLIKYMTKMIVRMYGLDPVHNPEFPKIINEKHIARLSYLLENNHILYGGRIRKDLCRIEPTIVDQVSWDSPIMREEIFGPILPVLTFYDIKEVIETVNARPKPLALYFFTSSRKREREIVNKISYGGGCINDTVLHAASPHLPFGGVGLSGMGAYHGQSGFTAFSHQKSILRKAAMLDIPVRYAPFRNKLDILKIIQ